MSVSDEQSEHGQSRLDRLEGLMQLLIDDHLKFRDEHRQLLTAQVLLTDQVGKLTDSVGTLALTVQQLAVALEALAGRVDTLAASIAELTESQKHTDERLNALINVVDDLVRKRPPPQSRPS